MTSFYCLHLFEYTLMKCLSDIRSYNGVCRGKHEYNSVYWWSRVTGRPWGPKQVKGPLACL